MVWRVLSYHILFPSPCSVFLEPLLHVDVSRCHLVGSSCLMIARSESQIGVTSASEASQEPAACSCP